MDNIFNKVKELEPAKIGSYNEKDVLFLLKDVGNFIDEQDTLQREKNIQSGRHYSEMLPIEYKPSEEYKNLFLKSLETYSLKIAESVGIVSELILKKKKENIVLVSLARAGIPAGILIKRFISEKHNIDLPHYSISIIRGRGIDENAILYILKKYPDRKIQFIDGWTGKGAIKKELESACENFNRKFGFKIDDSLAVIADPGYCTDLYGTRDDFLIPSACLNSTVSGLLSRTVLRDDIINDNDFHGVKYYKELKNEDLSNFFIDKISKKFINVEISSDILNKVGIIRNEEKYMGLNDIKNIQRKFDVDDINLIKPGIGETTRVLLRRLPWKILVKNIEDENLKHIILLAKEKEVEIEKFPLKSYLCCGVIKPLRRNY